MLPWHIGSHLLPQMKNETNVIKNKKVFRDTTYLLLVYVAERVMVWGACVLRAYSTTQRQGCQVIVEGASVWNRVFPECSAKMSPIVETFPHPKVHGLLSFGWIYNNSKRRTQGRFTAPDSGTRSLSLTLGGKLDLRERWSHHLGDFLKFCQGRRSQISFGHKVLKEKGYTVRFEFTFESLFGKNHIAVSHRKLTLQHWIGYKAIFVRLDWWDTVKPLNWGYLLGIKEHKQYLRCKRLLYRESIGVEWPHAHPHCLDDYLPMTRRELL